MEKIETKKYTEQHQRNQKTFDIVKKHLIKMKERCMKGARCRYRFGTNRCAIGILIPKRLYNPSIEDGTISQLFDKTSSHYLKGLKTYFLGKGLSIDTYFLSELQHTHDFRRMFKAKVKTLKSLSKKYKLKYN